MISRLRNWLIKVVFWGLIIALIFGFAMTKGIIAATAASHGNGFSLEGHAIFSVLKGIGGLFSPLWHWLTNGFSVKVHHR